MNEVKKKRSASRPLNDIKDLPRLSIFNEKIDLNNVLEY